jgi:hypothetical protein
VHCCSADSTLGKPARKVNSRTRIDYGAYSSLPRALAILHCGRLL